MLSVWDLGGQERWDFLKEQFFKGSAAVVLVFDLTRADSFKKLEFYLKEIRKHSGSIPLILVGNKNDLEEEASEISNEDIGSWMRVNQITDFIKTSAKTGDQITDMFTKISTLSIIDLNEKNPRLGVFRKDGVFQFKIVVVGAAGVGKTAIIHRFAKNVFFDDYEMTIGVDFLTKKVEIKEEILTEDILEKIKRLQEKSEITFLKEESESTLGALGEKGGSLSRSRPKVSLPSAPASIQPIDEKKPPSPPSPPSGPSPPRPSLPLKAKPSITFSADEIESISKDDSVDMEEDEEAGISELAEYEESFKKGGKKKAKKKAKKKVSRPTLKEKEVKEEIIPTGKGILKRKTTVFYQRQMNPLTHNKLSVTLSSEKIFEDLKKRITDTRSTSGKTLEIKEISPFVDVEPIFPSCVVVPAIIPLDARKESDEVNFDVTPLTTGDIEEACVRLYYEGKLIDTVPTPTRVVKQTVAKISAFFAIIVPVFGPLFDEKLSNWFPFLESFWSIWDTLGGIESFFLILAGIFVMISAISYYIKKRKNAQPVLAIFPSLDVLLEEVKIKQNFS